MTPEGPQLAPAELREALRWQAGDVLDPGDPEAAVERLWRLGISGGSSSALGTAIWQIWGRIHAEWTDSAGDSERGARRARQSAVELLEALDDRELERQCCERWIDLRS